jgi:hypothetical protein
MRDVTYAGSLGGRESNPREQKPAGFWFLPGRVQLPTDQSTCLQSQQRHRFVTELTTDSLRGGQIVLTQTIARPII